MAYASIDLDGMADLIRHMEVASDRLHHTVDNLRPRFNRTGVDTRDLTAIGEIAMWVDDELPGLRRRLHLATVADAQRSQALRGTPVQITEPTLTLAQATELGNDLAARVEDADLIGDPDAFDQLAQEIAANREDPDVMAAMVDRLGAQGLLDVMTRAAVPLQNSSATIDFDSREQMLIALRAGLNTADMMWSEPQAAAFATDLVNASTGDGSCSALSYLLYDSYYSDAFLSAAAEAIDTFERTGWEGNPGLWSPDTGQGQWWDQYFPPAAYQDPAISLMSALGNNPQAALDFFYQGSEPESVTDRQMYWLHDRDWSADQFAHLSEALLAATTDPSLTQPPDSASAGQAAHLASVTVNLIGDRDNISGSMISGDEAPTVAAENFALILSTYMHGVDNMVWTNDCEWNSGSVADYTLEYYDAVQHNTPMFNEESLRSFIALASSTETGITTLRQGMDTYASTKYAISLQYLAENPGSDTALQYFDYGYETQAKMEGLFVDAVGESAIARARGEDETRAAWIALGSDLVSVVPYGSLVTKAGGGALAAAVVNFTVGQAKKGATGSLSDAFASSEGAMVDEQNEAAEASFQRANYSVLRAVTQNPSLVPGGIPDWDWAPGGVLPSWEVFSDLPDGDQSEALSYLQSPDTGVGMIYHRIDFENDYTIAFLKYFEAGDG